MLLQRQMLYKLVKVVEDSLTGLAPVTAIIHKGMSHQLALLDLELCTVTKKHIKYILIGKSHQLALLYLELVHAICGQCSSRSVLTECFAIYFTYNSQCKPIVQ